MPRRRECPVPLLRARDAEPRGRLLTVLDCAYTPLRLTPHVPTRVPEGVWQMWTPNKALGLTGDLPDLAKP